MKLRNKKTGEVYSGWLTDLILNYNSLAGLSAEWEDYEEPNFYYINENGGVLKYVPSDPDGEDLTYMVYQEQIGNRFKTREEAEKAVEKLKAYKRLKDNGFRFIDWELDMKTIADGKIWFDVGTNTEWDAEHLLECEPEIKKSLDLLFGGEE